MRLLSLKCNNCNAQLEVDVDNLQARCPYCGQKLLFDFDQIELVLSEREKTKRSFNREAEITKRKKMEYDHESKEKDKEWSKKAISTVAIVLGALLMVFLYFYGITHMFDSDEKEHKERIAYLQQLEVEIDEAIINNDYDTARLKTFKLYLDDNWSSEETATWDAKREAYIALIEEKQREFDIQNPNNIFMPASYDEFIGKSATEVVEQLQEMGFTNVTSTAATQSSGLFKKTGTVEHILIGGVTEFAADDYFDKDTRIIVYYYSK